jgi:hypothetical protein
MVYVFCTDTGAVAAGAIQVGTYARHITPMDQNATFLQLFPDGCAPITERIVINTQPPVSGLGEYVNLEAVIFGRPGTTDLCFGLGKAGASAGAAPSGVVTLTFPQLRAFQGKPWEHPSLAQHNILRIHPWCAVVRQHPLGRELVVIVGQDIGWSRVIKPDEDPGLLTSLSEGTRRDFLRLGWCQSP